MAHILIIDSEATAAGELAAKLKRRGYTVDRVTDTAATFAFLRDRVPQLFILDLMTAVRGHPNEPPEGVRLLAQLYLDHPEVPLIVFSRSRKYRQQFWSWAAAAHISKRDGTGDVIEVVEKLLGPAA
jgi:DNA-binding response OmpR family regulator